METLKEWDLLEVGKFVVMFQEGDNHYYRQHGYDCMHRKPDKEFW